MTLTDLRHRQEVHGAAETRISSITALVAFLLLAVHAAMAVDASRSTSVTLDEVAHLPAGISYWQRGTFELYHHNPPLVKQLAALAALSASPKLDNPEASPDLWSFAWGFMYANAERYHEIYQRARLPVIALSLLTGLVVFRWAHELFGGAGALVSLGLWTFCPNAIAHAGLMTTDMGATSIGFVATYLFWRYLRRPTRRNAFLAGVFLGLAQLSKFSTLVLYPIWLGCWVVGRAAREERSFHPPGVDGLLIAFGVSILVINAGYGFQGTGARLGDYEVVSALLTRPRPPDPAFPPDPLHPWGFLLVERQNRFRDTWLGAVPVPLPREYVLGFDEQRLETEGLAGRGYAVYLLGELRRSGWWWYYILALGVKLPLGAWALTLLAASLAIRRSGRKALIDEASLLAPVLTLLAVMSFLTDVNLGLRYVLPLLPFWFVSLGRVATATGSGKGQAAVVAAALVWNVAACRFHPHHLAYFNELAGGPANGGEYLVDSNLDWGQDLRNLASWLRARPSRELKGFAYFGNVDPSILKASGAGFRFRLPPPTDPEMLQLWKLRPGSRAWRFLARWEQENLSAVREWVEKHPNRPPLSMPELRAALAEELGLSGGPEPGLYAISASFVYGLPFRVFDEDGNVWSVRPEAFGYFRKLEPIAKIGYSIFVYDLTALHHGSSP